MLEYEAYWENPSRLISDDPVSETSDHRFQEINMFNNNNNNHHHSAAALSLDYAHYGFTQSPNLTQTAFSQHQFLQHQAEQAMYDPREFPITSYEAQAHHQMDSLTGLNSSNMPATAGAGYFLVPKTEEGVVGPHQGTRIGLNFGHRTYFSAQDDDFVNRLYPRSRNGGMDGGCGVNTPRCQAEGCAADLSNAKHYHRRHKVCEFHSKASTVIAGGLTQRFCQQCSRFHLLTEFDDGKRSCRKRLADHNRRRRKTPQQQQKHPAQQSRLELQQSPVENSSDKLAKSPPESSAITTHPSSSVTIAISARMTLDCLSQRSHFKEMAASSSSSGSVFYSN